MAGSSAGGKFSEKQQQEANSSKNARSAAGAATGSSAVAAKNQNIVWRRRDTEQATTEGSLRALLNKLAPNGSLNSLATKVANYLVDDEAPDQLARQLVDRAQNEPLFASTYAKLSAVLVRMRSGFVFYKYLMCRCRPAFSNAVRSLITECPGETAVAYCKANENLSRSDTERHRLNALVVFVCHLFLEGLITFEQLHQDFMQSLECQLPDRVAIECLCSALNTAGRVFEEQRHQWLHAVMQKLNNCLHGLQQDRQLRMIFLIKDLVELHQRNWQPRQINLPDPMIEDLPEP